MARAIILFNEETNPTPVKFTHSTPLEIVWTIVPAIVLLFIAVPSFALLYSMDELIDPTITLKAVGHQWYWNAILLFIGSLYVGLTVPIQNNMGLQWVYSGRSSIIVKPL